ncbi:MAG: DUF2341 domain-containing protein [Kiritimatiellae bacterium]|nr:DUF2341 domain-containing protein [Kiritimatiellia bacterium]
MTSTAIFRVNRTFAEVLANIDRYAEQSAFFGWMCQILSNLHANDCRRKSNANTVYPGDVPDVADWSAQEAIFSGLDHESLRDAIEQLPEDIRKAVILHYFEEMPVREVARILSTPTGTIAWRLHCAREILAAKLSAGAKKAVSKPGAKALLIALALVAVAAVGAVGVVAIRSAAEPEAEEAEVVFNAKSTENTEGSLGVFEGWGEECLSSGADPTNHEINGDSPQQTEAITANSETNNEENTMNTQLVKSAAVKVLAAGAMLAAGSAVGDTINVGSFLKCMKVTIAYSPAETLTDFPVLLRLSADNPTGFDPNACGDGGADIRFALDDGTLLAHEIDYWNTNGESTVWVKVPELASGKSFTAYFDLKSGETAPTVDPTDVWEDYAAVYHFSEPSASSATANDSSKNHYTATSTAGSTSSSAGKVGLKRGNGSGTIGAFQTASVNLSSQSAAKPLTTCSKFSVSCWDYGGNSSAQRARILNQGSPGSTGWCFMHGQNYSWKLCAHGSGSTVGNAGVSNFDPSKGWHHYTAVFDGNLVKFYYDGTAYGPVTINPVTAVTAKLEMIDRWASMDEARIRDGVVSAAWAVADYAVQTRSDFVTYGEVTTPVSAFAQPIPAQTIRYLDEAMTPAVTVLDGSSQPLVQGNDYTVAYSNNTAVGTGYAEVTGIGDYNGWSVTLQFQIEPRLPVGEFGHRMAISPAVGLVSGALTNIPVLVRISSDRQKGLYPERIGAANLRFGLADGTIFPHEVEKWDPSGESLVWVLVPELKPDTKFYAYWRQIGSRTSIAVAPSEVWGDFAGVWHLNEEGGSAVDSTAYGHDLAVGDNTDNPIAKTDAANAGVEAVVGVGRDIPSSSSLFRAHSDSLAHGGEWMYEGWVKSDATTGESYFFKKHRGNTGSGGNGQSLRIDSANTRVRLWYGTVNWYPHEIYSPSNSFAVGEWHHVVGTVTAPQTARIYIDGQLVAGPTVLHDAAKDDTTMSLALGWSCAMVVDEMRYAKKPFPAEWIAFDYAQQSGAGALVYGKVENRIGFAVYLH